MTDPNRLARQQANANRAAMRALVQEELRDYLKTGVDAGTYGSFVWDGRRIIGAGESGGTVGARIRRAASFTLTTSGSDYSIDFDTEDNDDASYWAIGAPANIVVPTDGYYIAEFTVIFAANSTGQREAYITSSFICGSQIRGRMRVDAASSGTTILSGAGLLRVAAGCILTVHAVQSSGGSLDVTALCNINRLGAIPA